MENNNKTNKKPTSADNPAPKTHKEFDVTFKAFDYFTEKVTPETRCEYIFTQSFIFVDSILRAIHQLNKETESVSENDADALSTIDCTKHLALIAQGFGKEMEKQFHELKDLKGGQSDE